jgi:multiple sugar transport system permease protein
VRSSSLEKHSPLIMTAPMLLIIGLNIFFLVYVVSISLTKSTLAHPFNTWVGLNNYINAFSDEVFGSSIRNMLFFAIVATTLETVIGYVFALALHNQLRAQKYIRTLALLPMFTPPIAVAMIWKLIYDPSAAGLFNYYLVRLGLTNTPPAYLGNPNTAMASLILTDVWQWMPFCFLLILAALQSLPYEPYEAAAVDGASSWQVFRRLTFPLSLPSVIITFLFRLLIALKVFDLVFMLTYGGPGDTTNVASFYIYKVGFVTFRTGYAAALSVLILLLVSVLATGLTTGRSLFMSRRKGK